jgi:hypothetical protein
MAEASRTRAVLIYAGTVTILLALTPITRGAPGNQEFDEITVRRINIVEPDGTLRMVVADRSKLPGVIVRGKEGARNRPYAGMLFYDDEGSENGGLVFAGHRDANGRIVDSGGQLSFDKYGVGGMLIQLAGVSDNENRFAGLRVKDNSVAGPNNNRIWVGNGDDGAATVALMDMNGRKRLVMEVGADGASSLTFLDPNGKVLNRLAPSEGPR